LKRDEKKLTEYSVTSSRDTETRFSRNMGKSATRRSTASNIASHRQSQMRPKFELTTTRHFQGTTAAGESHNPTASSSGPERVTPRCAKRLQIPTATHEDGIHRKVHLLADSIPATCWQLPSSRWRSQGLRGLAL
jgi:hypothetical protein